MTSFFLFFFTTLTKPNAIRLHCKGMQTKKKRKEKKSKLSLIKVFKFFSTRTPDGANTSPMLFCRRNLEPTDVVFFDGEIDGLNFMLEKYQKRIVKDSYYPYQ